MGRPKNEDSELTRDKLEGFLWAATGWRGDPAVIDGILAKVDVYSQNRIRLAGLEKAAMVDAAKSAAARALAAKAPAPEQQLSRQVLDALIEASTFTGDAMGKVSTAVGAIEKAAQAVRDYQGSGLPAEPLWASLPGLEVRIHPEDMDKLSQWYETLVLKSARSIDLETAQEAAEEYVAEFEAEHGPISEEAYAEAEQVLSTVIADEPEVEHAPDISADDVQTDAEADAVVDAIIAAADDATVEHKRCNRCDLIKPLEEFHKDSSAPDGRKYTCKRCDAKRAAARADRDKVMAAQAAADTLLAAEAQ
jgi:hypothetical protein